MIDSSLLPSHQRESGDIPSSVNDFQWELAAEGITLRIRWIGLCVGYLLVNALHGESNTAILNAILTLGAVYAVLDTYWSVRGKVFLSNWPVVVSIMEAIFIGLLCHFDQGLNSPFRYYYFLSLIVCALRYTSGVTLATLGLHGTSYAALVFSRQRPTSDDFQTFILMLFWMGWVTWASTAFSKLIRTASRKMSLLNQKLQQDQTLLEARITQRTKELQESQALLVHQEKQAAFGLLAAGIAHEVGNPLAAISSLVQMLNRRDADHYTRERLQMVDDQLMRIQRTLRELVDFSRPANRQESLCDIHEVLEVALNIAKYYKRKKGKQIVTRFARGLPQLRVVRDQLVQVFLNLILNAMDATEEGGTIEITTSLSDGWIRVAICDDGHGISDRLKEQVFQPYFTTKPTGTGLGLFVCHRIIEQMRWGKIELTDTSNRGTTFTVSVTCDLVRQHPDVEPDASGHTTETIQELNIT
ncbi:MAG: ATP-binding protein [Planctomycetota bacterium]|nr:ATP-binding protein [Planctomycetota bacterium]MDA1213742.1 ATP-binding protein [Planctomycetota bacterium]